MEEHLTTDNSLLMVFTISDKSITMPGFSSVFKDRFDLHGIVPIVQSYQSRHVRFSNLTYPFSTIY
jgi:hypothetical protein